MRALKFYQTGGLGDLCIEEVPLPTPGPGEVLVQVKAAAVNSKRYQERTREDARNHGSANPRPRFSPVQSCKDPARFWGNRYLPRAVTSVSAGMVGRNLFVGGRAAALWRGCRVPGQGQTRPGSLRPLRNFGRGEGTIIRTCGISSY